MYALEGPLAVTSAFPFVGRSTELKRLRTLLPHANGEARRVVLLGGEAGCGKSRLVREFAAEASAGGALVLHGACDPVVRTPYGAFVEALEQLSRALDSDEVRDALGGELARLLPGVGAEAGRPRDVDPDTQRHRLHTAVADLLETVSRPRVTVVVIEDCHWADAATLLLIRHLARTGGTRLLLLATFRDTEAEVPAALAETLAELRRHDVVRLRLGGLSDDEVADFVARAGGSGPDTLARAMHALTGGNAFLVCELWRALLETGAVEIVDGTLHVLRTPEELGSPESVREVVSQRLARLGSPTALFLELAATAGTEFDLDVVRRAAALADGELMTALDAACRSGMIEEVPGRGLAWRFAHELVRRALYDRLSAPRRAELHLRVGEALEAAPGRSGRALVDLAHHFAAAVPFGPPERAVAYNLRAARAATAALAFDQAAARLRIALDLDAEPRPEVLLELGDASHRAGHALDALEAFKAAADLGRERGDAGLLARAAIGFEEACWRPTLTDQGAVELLETAAFALGPEDSELRVGLLGGLARALDLDGHRARAARERSRAIAMARRLGDRTALTTVLVRSYWSHGEDSIQNILALLTEARGLAEELGNTELLAEAMSWRVPALVALCDIEGAKRAIPALLAVAERTAQPFMLHVAEQYAGALALCDGRLAEAEAIAHRSHEWGRQLTGRDSSGVYGIQMFSVRREQGRLAELAPIVRILAGDPERDGAWRPSLAALLVELGMEEQGRRTLERVVADGLDPFRSSLWVASLAYLTDACTALGDETIAALLYPELERYGGGNVMVGHLVSCYGAADRYLGMLAATLGEAERAERHFEAALELNRRMGAVTWHAHTAYEYGRFLLGRGRAERKRAGALLGEAATLAGRIGMPALAARIRVLGSAAPADGLSPRETQILALVARGMSNRHLGEALCISEHTAANHVRSILRKTGCRNRTEAAAYAHRTGIA
jgi:DNA-binding CsgD family transcriptional regulator/tetratricopeptide (TPR) repeat protein